MGNIELKFYIPESQFAEMRLTLLQWHARYGGVLAIEGDVANSPVVKVRECKLLLEQVPLAAPPADLLWSDLSSIAWSKEGTI